MHYTVDMTNFNDHGQPKAIQEPVPPTEPELPTIPNIEHTTVTSSLRRLSSYTTEQVPWAIPERLPKGAVTLVAGKYGMGKSLLLLWLAEEADGKCAWLSTAEGGANYVLAPRAQAAGVNRDRIYVTQDKINLADDSADAWIRTQLDTLGDSGEPCGIVFFDSLKEHAPGYTSPTVAGRVMSMLSKIAEDYNVAIVLNTHFAKRTKHVADAISGHGSWQDLSRYIYVLGPASKPESRLEKLMGLKDPDREFLALACQKYSWSAAPETLLFRRRLVWNEESGRMEPMLEEAGFSEDTPQQVYEATRDEDNINPDAVDSAAMWIIQTLSPLPGKRMLSKDFEKAAADADISQRTLKRAKKIATWPKPLTRSERVGDVWWTVLCWGGLDPKKAKGATLVPSVDDGSAR